MATPGTEIWAQYGHYYPSGMLTVPDSVRLYGGFSGWEIDWTYRDLIVYQTIIDAQEQYGSVICLKPYSELNGFVIQNGNAQNNPKKHGGGVWAETNSVIENCIIRNNTAYNGGGVYGEGHVKIINSDIIDNTAIGYGYNTYGHCLTVSGFSAPANSCCIAPAFASNPSAADQRKEQGVGFPELSVSVLGTTPFTYQWYTSDDVAISGATSADYTPPCTTVGVERYYCVATNACGSTTSKHSGLHAVIEPCVPPTFTSHPNATDQFTELGVAFSTLSVSVTGTPPFTYQWWVNTANNNDGGDPLSGKVNTSYTPPCTTLGTKYYYCVVFNACGNAVSNVSGAHTVHVSTDTFGCTFAPFDFGVVTFASDTQRLVFDNATAQIWSDAVTTTNCQKTTFKGYTLDENGYKHLVDCRSNPDYPGDYFSWCAVVRYGDTLCPYPWRVPTKNEFIALDQIFGGTGENNQTTGHNKYMGSGPGKWGGYYGGSYMSSIIGQGNFAFYWSQTEYPPFPDLHGCNLTVDLNYYIHPQIGSSKWNGYSLRCVRDTALIACIAPSIIDHPNTDEQIQEQLAPFYALSVSAAGTKPLFYQWYSNTVNSNIGGTAIPNATSASYAPSTAVPSELYYYCVVSNPCGSEASNVSGLHTVVPCHAVFFFVHPNQDNHYAYHGTTFPELSASAAGNHYRTFQWYSNIIKQNSGGTAVGSAMTSNTVPTSYTPENGDGGILFYYCVVTDVCGSDTSNTSGAHADAPGCNADTCDIGAVSFTSNNEISISGNGISQIWSEPVTTTNCQKTAFDGGEGSFMYKADCRSNPNYPGDLFSWCAVIRYGALLCPHPWHVPTKQDFINLDIAMGGDGTSRDDVPAEELQRYTGTSANEWGGTYCGYGLKAGLTGQGAGGFYWSQNSSNMADGFSLEFNTDQPPHTQSSIRAAGHLPKYAGLSLRCVRE